MATRLLHALGIERGVVALAGAGGKTTLIFRLAREAQESGRRVLVTTTTHMGTLPESLTGPVFIEAEGDPAPGLAEALRREGRATLLGRRIREDKIEGIAPERVDALAGEADFVLVETDGARGRSLKVPAPHEPVVPASASVVVVLAALDVLGGPLDAERVHRLDVVAAATGRAIGEVVDEETFASALLHPQGYLARSPRAGRMGVFLNKVEDEPARAAAGRLAHRLLASYAFVAAGSARGGPLQFFGDLVS